jgi:hypothetical protein
MTTLSIDSRGIVTLEIAETADGDEDAGAVRSYTCEPLPAGLDVWRVSLTRLDTQETHTVTLTPAGWTCDCLDRKYRPRRSGGCKHVRAVRPLYHFCERLAAEPPP